MITAKASALLTITASQRAQARRHVNGYRRIEAQLGASVAAWAYADKGIGPGLRAPCAAATALARWKPTDGDWCIVLAGTQGTGKSVSAARYVADLGGLLVSATSCDAWGFGGGVSLARATEAEWLLIDDLGESKTRPGDGNLGTLIADRYASRARRKTVITTVLAIEQIEQRFGDNVGDRLRSHVVELFARETASRRGTADPVTTWFDRERVIAWYSEQVEYAAAGVIGMAQATEAIERLAAAAGIDLNGEAMRREIAAQEARRVEINDLAEAFVKTMSTAASPLRLVPPPDPAADELMAWVDSLDVEVGQ